MPNPPPEAMVGAVALVLSIVGGFHATQMWLHRRRRLAFRAAAVRAGLEPGAGKWVDAKCGTTAIVALEKYARSTRRNPEKTTSLRAELPGSFPEAFHASTSEDAIGLVRAKFPTTSGKHTVFVRGLNAADTLAFLDDERRDALAAGLDLAPDAALLPNVLSIHHHRWHSPEYLARAFAGFARICRTFAPAEGAYRDR